MGLVVLFGALLLLASYNYAATQTPVALTKAPHHTIPLRLDQQIHYFVRTQITHYTALSTHRNSRLF